MIKDLKNGNYYKRYSWLKKRESLKYFRKVL